MTASSAAPASDSEIAALERPWPALAALLLGVSLIVLEASLVNVLLPSIVTDLSLTRTQVLWSNAMYSLVFAALLITFGVLADRIGRRTTFVAGTVLFLVGSIAAGSAPTGELLIVARAVEAIGGAMMLPTSMAIINVQFTGNRRAAAFGLWGAVFGGMAALGPLLGGWLAQDFSWRWAFYINIPVGLASIVGMFLFVPDSKRAAQAKFDLVGVVLSAGGLGLLVFGLIAGQQYGWWTAIETFTLGPVELATGGLSVAPICIGVGVVLILAFVGWQIARNRAGRPAMVDTSLFGIRSYGFGNTVALIVSLGEFGVLFVLPLWIQSVKGFGPLETGAVVAMLAVGTFVAGGSARKAAAAIGATRLVRVGMVIEILGVIGVGLALSTEWSAWWLAVPLVVYGIGLGFDAAQLTNVVLADLPGDESGSASSVTSTFRQVGTALGSALLGALLFSALSSDLTTDLTADSALTDVQRSEVVEAVVGSSGQAIVPLEDQPGMTTAADDAKESFTAAARTTSWAAAGLIGIGLLFSFGLPGDTRATKAEPLDQEN